MEQFNRIELRGIVGSVRHGSAGERNVANFSLATSRAYTKKDGSAVIDTEWHRIVAWENASLPDLSQIEKGSKLKVVGRLTYRKWTGTDGAEHDEAEVQAAQIEFINESLSSQLSA